MNLSNQAIQKAINNQWKDAIEINQQILLEDPQNIDALNRLAQAYFNLCKLKQSKKFYYQVLKIDSYNPIAKRNLDKINNLLKNKQTKTPSLSSQFDFIEEPGKTKIVSLVSPGERSVLSLLRPCTKLDLNVRKKTISLYYQEKYVGRLPDDIAKRIIWLHQRSNKYEAFAKSIGKNKLTVFLKEIKQSPKNKNHASFI